MRRRELILLLGGAMAAPRVLRAQQRMPVIGYLSYAPQSDAWRAAAYRRGLTEAGYVEGQNVAIEYRWAEGDTARLPDLAAELVRLQVSVIFAVGGTPPALAAKAATSKTPIVFVLGVDPVQSGLVSSLNRPGGNVTGVVMLTTEMSAKRLDLLHQLLPTAATFALLANPTNRFNDPEVKSAQDAARALGLQLRILQASTPSEIETAFGMLAELRADGLIVSADPLFTNLRDQIVALSARHRIPAIYIWSEFAAAGGLMSYGSDIADSFRLAGFNTGKILNGASPADLPVEQVTKIELFINLKTAEALGLTVPPSLLARADEVIE